MTSEMTDQAPDAVVSEELRALLARRRVTQVQLAERFGTSQTYWSRRIVGRVPVGFADVVALADYLEMPVSELVATLVAPLDMVAGGRPPIGRYGDTPGHDAPRAHVCLWEDDNTFWQCETCQGCANCCACPDDDDYDHVLTTSRNAWELAA